MTAIKVTDIPPLHRPARMAPPEAPRAVDLAPDTRKLVVAAVKTVMVRLQQAGRFAAEAEYATVLGSPALLHDLITAYRAEPAIARDLAVDATGAPVADWSTPLVCGLSLAQVCQLLVFTCARRVFTESEAPPRRRPRPRRRRPRPGCSAASRRRRRSRPSSARGSGGWST